MKKVSLLVLVCMILSLAFVSCDMITSHEHSFGTEWLNDGKNHFNACSGCSEKRDFAAHADANGDNACDICGFPIENLYSVHEHEYNTAWAFDATNHFHTCKTCVAVTASAAHVDEDKNNACDVCGYIIENLYEIHEHSFGSAWLFDGENHFHRCDTCTEVSGLEAHADADGDNDCDVCGCILENLAPDAQGTMAGVIEAAVLKDGLVNGGTVNYTYNNADEVYGSVITTFVMGADFADYNINRLGEDYFGNPFTPYNKYYSLVNGNLYVLSDEYGALEKLEYQADGWITGYAFEYATGSATVDTYYGLADVVSSLYALGLENGTLSEKTITEGDATYYCFTLEIYSYGLLDEISVLFTLGEGGNFESAKIEALSYAAEEKYDDEYNVVGYDKTYGIPSTRYIYDVVLTTGELAETSGGNPYDYLVSDFVIKDADGNEVTTIDTIAGSYLFGYAIEAVNPGEKTNPTLDIFTSDVTFANVSYYGAAELSIDVPSVAGTYTIKLTSLNGAEKTITLNVAPKPLTTIYPLLVVNNVSVDTDTATVRLLDTTISAEVGTSNNTGIEHPYTVAITSAPDGNNATVVATANGTYIFTTDTIGEYVLTFTATENADITATMTITVAGPATAENLGLIGSTFEASYGTWDRNTMEYMSWVATLTFSETTVTVSDPDGLSFGWQNGVTGGTFDYTVSPDGTINVVGAPFSISYDAVNGVYTYDGYELSMTVDGSAGGDNDGDDVNPGESVELTGEWKSVERDPQDPSFSLYTIDFSYSEIFYNGSWYGFTYTFDGTNISFVLTDTALADATWSYDGNIVATLANGSTVTFLNPNPTTPDEPTEPGAATEITGVENYKTENAPAVAQETTTYSTTIPAGATHYFLAEYIDIAYNATITFENTDITFYYGNPMMRPMASQSGASFVIDANNYMQYFWFTNDTESDITFEFTVTIAEVPVSGSNVDVAAEINGKTYNSDVEAFGSSRFNIEFNVDVDGSTYTDIIDNADYIFADFTYTVDGNNIIITFTDAEYNGTFAGATFVYENGSIIATLATPFDNNGTSVSVITFTTQE